MNLTLTQEQAEGILRFADGVLRVTGLQFARQAVEVLDIINAAAAAAQPAADPAAPEPPAP